MNHQNNFATAVTSNQSAAVTTTPLNDIPTVDAPFYLALDATNVNGNYEVIVVTSKTATNVNHAATANAHTTAEEVRMVIPAEEMNNLSTLPTQVDGAWIDWTPSWTNLSVGNGVQTAKYTQIGKTVHGHINITFGSTTAVSGSVTVDLPATISTSYSTDKNRIGKAVLVDTGTNFFLGTLDYDKSSAICTLYFDQVSGTNIRYGVTSSTAPFTWTTGDELMIEFVFEAA